MKVAESTGLTAVPVEMNFCSSVISVICSASVHEKKTQQSVRMLRPDEMHETVEILQARGEPVLSLSK